MKGHSLWHLVPFLKAEVGIWIVCPHSRPPVLQSCLNVLIAPLLSSFSYFPRPSLFAFQVCRGTRMKSMSPGISERITVEIIEGSNKFELHFCTRTGSPHTSKRGNKEEEAIGVCVSRGQHWTVWRGFFIKPLGNSGSWEGGLLCKEVLNGENEVVQCSVFLLLLCSCFLTWYSETGPEWVLGNFALTEIALQVLFVICSNCCLSVLVLFCTFVWVVWDLRHLPSYLVSLTAWRIWDFWKECFSVFT